MINNEDLKLYHRQLALYCLQSTDQPLTSGECADMMQTAALNAMHDEPCWKRIDAGKVAGTLKALVNSGAALKADPARNARAGRDQERWTQNPIAERVDLPECPGESEPPPRAQVLVASDPYQHLSREQLVAMMLVHDELGVAIANFKSELNDIEQRARRQLAAVGLEPGNGG